MAIAITTALYILILFTITYLSKRKEGDTDFLIASRNLGWQSIGLSVFASLISSFNIVIGITFAYLFGVYYLVIFLSLIGAYIFFYYFYKQHKRLFAAERLLTVVDYFKYRFGTSVARIAETIFLVVLLFFITLQINVNTQVFTALFSVDKYTAVIAIAGIVLLYVMIGGFKTVVKTDIFQGIFMLAIVFLALFVGTEYIEPSGVVANISNTTLLFSALALLVVQFLTLISQPELWQRVYAAKNSKELWRGFTFSFVLLLVALTPIMLIGMNANFGGLLEDPGNAFFEVLSFGAPSWFVPILSVSLLAAFMSTLDSSLFALSSQLAKNTFVKLNSRSIAWNTRFWIPIVLIVATSLSLFVSDLLTSVFQLVSLLTVTSTVFLASFILRMRNVEVGIAVVVGVIAFIYALYGGVITQEPITSLYPSFFVAGFIVVQHVVFNFLPNRPTA